MRLERDDISLSLSEYLTVTMFADRKLESPSSE